MKRPKPLPLRSLPESIVWPGVPEPKFAPVHAVLTQLEQSQWLSPETLERLQMEQLRALLLFAQREVPFYRDRLAPFVGRLADAPLDMSLWRELPLLSRAEIQSAGPDIEAKSLPKNHGRTTRSQTSGSTGKPVEIVHTQLYTLMWHAVTIRNHFWHGRDFSGTLAMIRGRSEGADYPGGLRANNWGIPAVAGIETGPCLSLDINATPEQQLEWLVRKDPEYFITHPTNLQRVAECALAGGTRIPKLREVMTVAEILTPDIRRLVRKAWDVPIVDMYTARDLGYIALQCPEFEHYHIQSETNLVEILDDEGQPCEPGQVGRIVCTPLHEFAMPLIRYENGDHAEVGPPCPCGRGLPVITRILGRTQQMLTLPSGEKRWTLFGGEKLADLRAFGATQFQFVQRSPALLELRLVTERVLDAAEQEAVKTWVKDTYSHELAVELTFHEELPRTSEGKFFDFISEVPV